MSRLARSSGILAHVSSLPGAWGIGNLTAARDQFVPYLASASQTLWQVLPLTPTGFGNSPYSAPSAFAGNTLLIDLQPLLDDGLLDEANVADLRRLPQEHVDFSALIPLHRAALETAAARAAQRADWRERLANFQRDESDWLSDYALFAALTERHGGNWLSWPEPLRTRQQRALQQAADELRDAVNLHVFGQYLFMQQWNAVRAACTEAGIKIVGDIPIFVAHDSADVWANRDQFKLDAQGRSLVMAGVPPDFFSETGQLWGNPIYNWQAMQRDGYQWWRRRFRQLLRLVDIVRVDHFRGFQAAWEVPAGAETAKKGEWVAGPGADLFDAVERDLGDAIPILVEDLGIITDAVRELVRQLGFPGMKVLQFAFGADADYAENPYLPHNYDTPNCVVYTGTHDNNTTRGWYVELSEAERDFMRRYLARDGHDVSWDLIRTALGSIADTAILPLQDVLDLGPEARMNIPGRADGNWAWRVLPQQLLPEPARRLAEMAALYGRVAQAAE